MKTVSRTEIAGCLEDAFGGAGALTCADVVAFAADHGARPPVLKVLGRLSESAYRDLRELWSELADVPVER